MRSGSRYGLVGDPVRHSLSPRLYEAAFDLLGSTARYETFQVPRGDRVTLGRRLRDLAATGGGNVTVPHKEEAARCLDVRLGAVEATGACNCFWLDDTGQLVGDNTDVGGFLAAADSVGLCLRGTRVLLLGAGGAARAVAAAVQGAGARSTDILNRTRQRAEALIASLGLERARALTSTADVLGSYDLVVNATSLGLDSREPLPLVLSKERFGWAMDLVYGKGGTAWTRHARSVGVPSIDGRVMLVRQALLSLERWLGPLESPDAVERVMSRAATDALNQAAG